jgi:ribonuclease T1
LNGERTLANVLNCLILWHGLELSGLFLYHSRFRIQGKPVFFSGRPLMWRTPCKRLLVVTVVGVLLASVGAFAKAPAPVAGEVALAELPREAQTTVAAVRSGGPFVDSKDGTVFGNRERQLPAEARGYYREYTVKTPGAPNRGAKRIVCGGSRPTAPEACYYTSDHYASFRRIVQ